MKTYCLYEKKKPNSLDPFVTRAQNGNLIETSVSTSCEKLRVDLLKILKAEIYLISLNV